ncbi:porin [Cupriavidus necator]|uniref:porin n=1 Tax=Cupriavidus necator TaxID=106590 RepID=UPI0009C0C7A3|nr:porin [Cupriavidus necator]
MVRKRVLAGGLLAGIASGAQAQTMQLYGVADASIDYAAGSKKVLRMRDGEQAASRLGLKVTETVAAGTNVNAVLEAGINVDSGAEFFGNGTLFGRQAYVGMSNGWWGELRLGRQYTPAFYALSRLDPFSNNGAVSPFNLLASNASQGNAQLAYAARFNNAIGYLSPRFGGLSFSLMAAPGEVPGEPRSGLNLGANVRFDGDRLYAFYAYQGGYTAATANGTPAPGTHLTNNHFIGASYRVGPVELGAMAGQASSNSPATKVARHYGATLNWDITDSNALLLALVKRYVKGGNQPFALTFGFDHALSKRTAIYTRAVLVHNSPGGSITINAIPIDANSGDAAKSISLGIRHRF